MKQVLDACCGSRMMWFNKKDERCLFGDMRCETMTICHMPSKKGRSPIVIDPDEIHDFRNMPYPDNTFYHVVFDPPHVENISMKSTLGFSYGTLTSNWQEDLAKGFAECFRVLKPNGTLIFKWNEIHIPIKSVLALTDKKPLYGHRSGKKANTHWVAFIKEDEDNVG
jgi:SAM-dependent methyltransferase